MRAEARLTGWDPRRRQPAPGRRAAEITGWSQSPSRARRVAAVLARDLTAAPPGTRVESSKKIAARFHVSNTTAVTARQLLKDEGIISRNPFTRRCYTLPAFIAEQEIPLAGR